MCDRYVTDDAAATLLERRRFAAGRAALETRAECDVLAQVLDLTEEAWRVARTRLSRFEALRDALGEELAAADALDLTAAPATAQRSTASVRTSAVDTAARGTSAKLVRSISALAAVPFQRDSHAFRRCNNVGHAGRPRGLPEAPSRSNSVQHGIPEACQVRMNAAQVAHYPQKQAALFSLGRNVRAGRPARDSGIAQQLYAERRGSRFQLAKMGFAFHQQPRVRRVTAQKNGHGESQAFQQLGMHRGNRGKFHTRERLAAFDLLNRRVRQAVGDDVTDVL